MTTLTKNQKQHFTKRVDIDGTPCKMTVQVRFDDECGNGHNTFAITADIRGRFIDMGGCLHDEIREHFPELAHLDPLAFSVNRWPDALHRKHHLPRQPNKMERGTKNPGH